MKFEIRGKTFDITFVNNYVREQYALLLDLSDEISDLPDKINEIDQSEAGVVEKRKAFRGVKKEQRELVKQISEVREAILKELLETNGYDYDAEWWRRKTTANDINKFTLDCVQKDVEAEDVPKKK